MKIKTKRQSSDVNSVKELSDGQSQVSGIAKGLRPVSWTPPQVFCFVTMAITDLVYISKENYGLVGKCCFRFRCVEENGMALGTDGLHQKYCLPVNICSEHSP